LCLKCCLEKELMAWNYNLFQKSLVMRIRIAYKIDGKDKLEEGQVSTFPRGLWGQRSNGDYGMHKALIVFHILWSLVHFSASFLHMRAAWFKFWLKFQVSLVAWLASHIFSTFSSPFFIRWFVYISTIYSSCMKMWKSNFAFWGRAFTCPVENFWCFILFWSYLLVMLLS